MMGPSPIDTVGNCQNSGISHGCGYDDRPPPVGQLAAEVLELLPADSPFEERAGVDARRGVPLEVDDVGLLRVGAAAEEVVEAHLVQRRGGGVRRDVAADPVAQLVGAHDHRERVPADEALDPPFELLVPGKRGLLADGDRVRVRRVRGERDPRARAARVRVELPEQLCRAGNAAGLQDVIERFEPLTAFDGVGRRILRQGWVSHGYAIPRDVNITF